MEQNEPTTGEIVRALRTCNNRKGERCSQCPVFSKYGYPRTCKRTVDLKAADRLESQERENKRISTDRDCIMEAFMSICTVAFKVSASCADKDKQIAALTARAEQAERERDAAVKDIEELLGQDDYIGICWACNNHDKCVGTRDVKITCVPKWRGLPQEGE